LTKEEKNSIIPSFIFLKTKYKPDGSEDKVKARLVAGGHQQDKTLYQDTSSPTAANKNVFIEAALAAKKNYKVMTVDIGSAYLNAEMVGTNIYMKLDKKLTNILCNMFPHYNDYVYNGIITVLLKKALYGCIQSALLWYNEIKSTILSMGYELNPYDQCIFRKNNGDNEIIIIIYVDDLFISSNSDELAEEIIKRLTDKYKEIKINYGNEHSYLGMNFKFDNKKVNITMPGYIDNLLRDNNITKKSPTPADVDLFKITDEQMLPIQEQKEIHTTIAKLLYLATRARPDLLLVVNFLSTRVNKFTSEDKKKLLRALQYLNKTKQIGLTLSVIGNNNDLDVTIFADASYGVHDDGKSQSASVTTLGNGSIITTCNKQKIVAKSSSEAELFAANDAVSEALNIRNYLMWRGHNIGPALLMQDNLSTKSILNNGINSIKRMKHLNVKYFFIKDYVENGELIIKYVPTNDMVADVMTKPLQGKQFKKLRNMLLGNVHED